MDGMLNSGGHLKHSGGNINKTERFGLKIIFQLAIESIPENNSQKNIHSSMFRCLTKFGSI